MAKVARTLLQIAKVALQKGAEQLVAETIRNVCSWN